MKIEADEIKVLILLSNDYSNDVGKYHFHLKASKILNENGSIIPPYFQKEEHKIKDTTVVIINYNKFKNFYDLERRFKIIESIILHELVHWYDLYYTYNNLIVEKYGNVFEKRSLVRLKAQSAAFIKIDLKYVQNIIKKSTYHSIRFTIWI